MTGDRYTMSAAVVLVALLAQPAKPKAGDGCDQLCRERQVSMACGNLFCYNYLEPICLMCNIEYNGACRPQEEDNLTDSRCWNVGDSVQGWIIAPGLCDPICDCDGRDWVEATKPSVVEATPASYTRYKCHEGVS